MRRTRSIASAALALGLAAVAFAQDAAPAARYAANMEAELRQLGIDAQCASESQSRHHCRYARPSAAGHRELSFGGIAPALRGGAMSMHVVYSDDSDTVYFYVERYLVVPSDHARAATVLRRLMELNWELLVGKFEWNPRTGEVRLSATLNTDSNFDRRAFRSIVGALDVIAARYVAELNDLRGP
jgi:hypothetical protein